MLDTGDGSALSHTTALAWWNVPGFVLDDIHVVHARDGVHRPRRLATHVHDVVTLPEHHVRELEGVPVVSPARALFDLAGLPRMYLARVERAVDNAWSQRLVSGRRQVDSGDDEGWIGRVDFGAENLPFRLEVQSERFHSSLLDSRADATRIARLEVVRAGLAVLAPVSSIGVEETGARTKVVSCG